MPKSERPYQWSFDFGRKDEPSIYYELGFAGHENRQDTGRFVRKLKEEVQIRSPNDAAAHLLKHVFTPFEAFSQEELWCLLLNTKNLITHEVMVYRGTVDTVYIRPAELFKEAVRVNAPALLLSHVHPSGNTEPSPEDIRVTQDAHQAGQLLGINVLDHIIIGNGVWASLKERRLGFE
jgi:DNA repair protein RadC